MLTEISSFKVIKDRVECEILTRLEEMIFDAMIDGLAYIIIPSGWMNPSFLFVQKETEILGIKYDEKKQSYVLKIEYVA